MFWTNMYTFEVSYNKAEKVVLYIVKIVWTGVYWYQSPAWSLDFLKSTPIIPTAKYEPELLQRIRLF